MDLSEALYVLVLSVYLFVQVLAKNPENCDVYKDCVECKAFSTGAFGVMDCLHHCDIANYIPVDDTDFELELKDVSLCQYKNDENCFFSFRMGKETDFGPDLYVKQELDCPTYVPTHPAVIAVDVATKTTTSTSTKMTPPSVKKGDRQGDGNGNVQADSAVIEDAHAVAGSEKDSNLISDSGKTDPNGASVGYLSLSVLLACFIVLKHL